MCYDVSVIVQAHRDVLPWLEPGDVYLLLRRRGRGDGHLYNPADLAFIPWHRVMTVKSKPSTDGLPAFRTIIREIKSNSTFMAPIAG